MSEFRVLEDGSVELHGKLGEASFRNRNCGARTRCRLNVYASFYCSNSWLSSNRVVITTATLATLCLRTHMHSQRVGTENHSLLDNRRKALKGYIKIFQRAKGV